jgi:hypothetical protein
MPRVRKPRQLTHGTIYLGPGHCAPEVWQEIKIVALINKVTVGHAVSVALMEYLKKHNGRTK